MALSDVELGNSALIKVGGATITSLDEPSRNARLIKSQLPIIRRKLLSHHPWNFAMARVELAATANTPKFQFEKEFLLPSDVLRVWETDLPDGAKWRVEFNEDNNKVLVCNAEAIQILYIKDITDPTKFPPYFDEALAWALATDVCYAITQSFSVSNQIYTAAQNEVRQARSMDGQESGPEVFEAPPWIDVRF